MSETVLSIGPISFGETKNLTVTYIYWGAVELVHQGSSVYKKKMKRGKNPDY